jgi:hypothetical protein
VPAVPVVVPLPALPLAPPPAPGITPPLPATALPLPLLPWCVSFCTGGSDACALQP